jgi:hypothetical protein
MIIHSIYYDLGKVEKIKNKMGGFAEVATDTS